MMGGSSGGSFLGSDPHGLGDKLQSASQEAEDAAYCSAVEELLADTLADANDRDTDAVARHLETIRRALEKDIEGVVDLLFGGSVAKRTYVDGLSDVDALVVVNDSELTESDPKSACDYILRRLSERFPERVNADGFAITVRFTDIRVQVVPVVRRGSDYLLPSDDCRQWSRVRPRAFSDALTKTNKACSGKLIPTIKLVKVLLSSIPEVRRPTGYHIENLAVETFSDYKGPYTYRAMLREFFSRAPDLIRTPIPDRTGQSSHVDNYLGACSSTRRLSVADAVARIGRRLRNADTTNNVELWRRLLKGD